MKGYMSAREASYKWGVSESRVHKLCQAGRIPGLERFGRSWVIPENAEKPDNPRNRKEAAIPEINQQADMWDVDDLL
jgi:hypothetical protein